MDINFKLYHYEKVLLCYFKHDSNSFGDSGCIVYTPDDMNIAGTLIGGVTNSNPSYFMPASRTVEKYGLELY